VASTAEALERAAEEPEPQALRAIAPSTTTIGPLARMVRA
jgi:hypothetical protein